MLRIHCRSTTAGLGSGGIISLGSHPDPSPTPANRQIVAPSTLKDRNLATHLSLFHFVCLVKDRGPAGTVVLVAHLEPCQINSPDCSEDYCSMRGKLEMYLI